MQLSLCLLPFALRPSPCYISSIRPTCLAAISMVTISLLEHLFSSNQKKREQSNQQSKQTNLAKLSNHPNNLLIEESLQKAQTINFSNFRSTASNIFTPSLGSPLHLQQTQPPRSHYTFNLIYSNHLIFLSLVDPDLVYIYQYFSNKAFGLLAMISSIQFIL